MLTATLVTLGFIAYTGFTWYYGKQADQDQLQK